MAAERPLCERRGFEIKMGRAKFPGKPSKIGNRKRVNLSSCALPDDNDSSKAAENIYLGLSVFNETFGDNEMVAPGPFHGFSMSEVEDAMAEARLQQKEAEAEHKKQGIKINLWGEFQNELFSIGSCSSYESNDNKSEVTKTKQCFDGGGKSIENKSTNLSDIKPSKSSVKEAGSVGVTKLTTSQKQSTNFKSKKVCSSPVKRSLRLSKSSIFKLSNSPNKKSLESQAAKRLLEKAKKSNMIECNKTSTEKKFVLPSHSVHSSRVIKPNKRFLDDEESREGKLLRSKSKQLAMLRQRTEGDERSVQADVNDDVKKKAACRKEDPDESTPIKELKCQIAQEPVKTNLSSGKVILREARLQLDSSNLSLMEGPFSSPNASSLSPNSQLKVSCLQASGIPATVVCGVCGAVRFYRFVKQARKFGIFSCESCRKFISKMIKKQSHFGDDKPVVQCQKGKGLCAVPPIVRSTAWNVVRCANNARCPACWLKLCLRSFRMPEKTKRRLSKLLPLEMRNNMIAEPLSLSSSNPIKFVVGDKNLKDFKWLHENRSESKPASKASSTGERGSEGVADSTKKKQKKLRKSLRTQKELEVAKHNGKKKQDRQHVSLKGPRVKHVCRSASVVLGQPLATFPEAKEPPAETLEDWNPPEEAKKEEKKEEKVVMVEKKPPGGKAVASSRPPGLMQLSKSKKKNVPAENLISMDFWESYDPDEVCETGFGLIGSEPFSLRALCYLCGSAGQEKLIHCACCCEPYHEFCVDNGQVRLHEAGSGWRYDWVCPRCTVCTACNRSSGQQLKCIRCSNSYHTECVDRVGGRLLHSPDRPWVCSACLRCKSCNGVDVSVFVGNLPLCKPCFALRQKGNYCPLCQRCYEDDDFDSKMMECGLCQCWVHAKCEGLSDEKYQVLSFLPESVEFVCRMCCSMPPAAWWLAVEAELKAGYLGVLKALSKNRKACTMLKWSPRKQCTCRALSYVPRTLDFDAKPVKEEEEKKPAAVVERKTSMEVINHPTESLKLTLKVMKEDTPKEEEQVKSMCERFNIKECCVRVKKCLLGEQEGSVDSLAPFDCPEDSQASLQSLSASPAELREKRSLSSPINPPSDSGIGSTDDELKASCLTDEESCKPDRRKSSGDLPSTFFEDKRECFCFLEVDSYNSRSKPFSPNLLSIKKKVTTSEYSSLQQFHQDMQRMIATTQSVELMEVYHQTMKEIFPWFDPKFSRVHSNSQKPSGALSVENTPVKSTPSKSCSNELCTIPKDKLCGRPTEYFYNNYTVEDSRVCLMCKVVGDGAPGESGRLLYCGQNEWVHCNCALWSGEVFEEIDGSLQNVHSAINRGRSIRCPECELKGASIGCCARNCQETYHFPCARRVGCVFMDDKTVYCPAHCEESRDKPVQIEKEFELRRPVYVELDKRKMKMAESSLLRLSVGGLHVESLGQFVMRLSDQPEAILPAQFRSTRLFWSCYEPWRIVRYHFSIRVLEVEQDEGVDLGVNLTIDHSRESELVELKMKQLRYFQENYKFLDVNEKHLEEKLKEKRRLAELKALEESRKLKQLDEAVKAIMPPKRSKKDAKLSRKMFENLDSKDDENLSDNQNTADLLPPDIEEAIFKDLPHDILDGISMQDIFMDIKNDPFEGEKDAKDDLIDDVSEVDELVTEGQKLKRDFTGDIGGEFWLLPNDVKQSEGLDEIYKVARDLKRSKSDVMPSQPAKKVSTLRNHQRSCSLHWNCKLDGPTSKWKRKCHTAEGGRAGLQELKLTDGLVAISTGTVGLDSLKARLQQEEGKENKCLPWLTGPGRMQPRLLQVDGAVDSSSSGSEAGESPQRLIDENTSRSLPPQTAPPYHPPDYPYPCETFVLPPEYDPRLPQIDGGNDPSSDSSDTDDLVKETKVSNWFTLSQLDGNVDSESEGGESPKRDLLDDEDFLLPVGAVTEEEPVKCCQCHCTYRTKLSYQRHLENCCNDFILSSSEGEMSEEEGSKKQEAKAEIAVKIENNISPPELTDVEKVSPTASLIPDPVQEVDSPGRLEIKRAKPASKPRTYTRRKPQQTMAAPPVMNNTLQMFHSQQQAAIPPALIVQDVPTPSMVPTAFIDSGGTLQYVMEPQNSFNKPQLIATPSPLVPGTFQIQTAADQMVPGLSVLPQGVQLTGSHPGIILQPSQPAPLVVTGDQMMLGSTPLFEVIQDPQTGGMFLASHNQPVLYNMETIVQNTVMQTNQFVSNVMATSSFSQTSTQVFQASKLEQVVNVPSNFIVVQQPGSLLQVPQSVVMHSHPTQSFSAEPKVTQISPLRSIQPFNKTMGKPFSPAGLQSKVTHQFLAAPPHQVNAQPRFVFQSQTFENRPVAMQAPAKNPPIYARTVPMMRPSVSRPAPKPYEKAVVVPKTKPRPRPLVDYINNFKSDLCDLSPVSTPAPLPPPPLPPPPATPTHQECTVSVLCSSPLTQSATVSFSPTISYTSPKALPPTKHVFSPPPSTCTSAPAPLLPQPLPPVPPLSPPSTSSYSISTSSPSVVASTPLTVTVTSPRSPLKPLPSPSLPVLSTINPLALSSLKTFPLDRELKLNINMPSLDDSPPPSFTESSQGSCDSFNKKETPPGVLAPLQDSQTKNCPQVVPKSPQKVAPPPNEQKPVPEEPPKPKKKLDTSDQNCIATKLVTIHPRLVQNPMKQDKNGKMQLKLEDKGPKLIFDVTSDDGFKSSSTSMVELWANICDSVQEMRAAFKIPPLPVSRGGHQILGMQNHGLQHCLEQLRGVEQCVRYKCKYFLKEGDRDEEGVAQVKENLTGSARTERFVEHKEHDIFAWLASRHRKLPKLTEAAEEFAISNRRANSLPMAMRYRHLRETSKLFVGVYRSKIHGKGLFCLREIESGEMVIEYAGEVIRSSLTDKREKYYTDKGIGCYMFRIDDHLVVDATMKGNAARFINHSCEPNCYSKVVDILGKKHIVIFALRRINIMEELTYDYKFPFEDEKISCHCLSKKCRKYLN